MRPGFLENELSVRSSNGRDDVRLEPLRYRAKSGKLYRVPKGATTDGMSTPAFARAIPGFEPFGKHWFSAVLHDAAYRGTLEISRFGYYEHANLTRAEADDLIREALATQGIGPIRRGVIHAALRMFGWTAYRK